MRIYLSELATRLGLTFVGKDRELAGLAPLGEAGPDQLSFVADARYVQNLRTTKAGAVVCSAEHVEAVPQGVAALVAPLESGGPAMVMTRVAALFHQSEGAPADLEPGVHPMAHVDETAHVDPSATVYPFAFVGAGAVLGPGVVVYPHVYVGQQAQVGENSVLYPGATVMARARLQADVVLHPGAVVGADGFGFLPGPAGLVKVPQVGGVVLERGVELGANTCVDKGALGDTVVGQGTKIDNLTQIAHNVRIGRHTVLAGQVGVSGSAKIGSGVQVGGQAGLADHISVGDGARIGAQSGLMRDVEPGKDVFGYPATDAKAYLRSVAHMLKLPQLAARLRKLEKDLAAITDRLDKGS